MPSSQEITLSSFLNSCFQYFFSSYPPASTNCLNSLFVTSYFPIKKSFSLPDSVSVESTLTIPSGRLSLLSSLRKISQPEIRSGSPPKFHVEATAKRVSYPSFSNFQRNIPIGTLKLSRGVTPRNDQLCQAWYIPLYKPLRPVDR